MTVVRGNALRLPFRDGSLQTCVTSPPYWGLRDYGVAGQLGLEATPAEYVANMVEVFREVRRVLRSDGTLWLDLGDCYATAGGSGTQGANGQRAGRRHTAEMSSAKGVPAGLKPKDLCGIPWRVAIALQDDGWWLRMDNIWHKPNPMPESVIDRPTRAHEYLFLLAKSERYYYDADAIREPLAAKTRTTFGSGRKSKGTDALGKVASHNWSESCPERKPRLLQDGTEAGANKRSVWTVASKPYAEAHFATFPPDLIRPCIRAGAPRGGRVLDPFVGAGTTLLVCAEEGRLGFGVELNPEYARLAEQRSLGAQARMELGHETR